MYNFTFVFGSGSQNVNSYKVQTRGLGYIKSSLNNLYQACDDNHHPIKENINKQACKFVNGMHCLVNFSECDFLRDNFVSTEPNQNFQKRDPVHLRFHPDVVCTPQTWIKLLLDLAKQLQPPRLRSIFKINSGILHARQRKRQHQIEAKYVETPHQRHPDRAQQRARNRANHKSYKSNNKMKSSNSNHSNQSFNHNHSASNKNKSNNHTSFQSTSITVTHSDWLKLMSRLNYDCYLAMNKQPITAMDDLYSGAVDYHGILQFHDYLAKYTNTFIRHGFKVDNQNNTLVGFQATSTLRENEYLFGKKYAEYQTVDKTDSKRIHKLFELVKAGHKYIVCVFNSDYALLKIRPMQANDIVSIIHSIQNNIKADPDLKYKILKSLKSKPNN